MPVVVGMTAQTMMVIMTPARIRKPPRISILGKARLAKRTVPQQIQPHKMYATKTCHAWA